MLDSYGSVNNDMKRLMAVFQQENGGTAQANNENALSPPVVSATTLARVRSISDQLEKAERAATISHNLILGICKSSMDCD